MGTEHSKPREVILPPLSTHEALMTACTNRAAISANTRLVLGHDALAISGPFGPQDWRNRVKGEFGIQRIVPQEYIDSRDALVIAQLGFSLRLGPFGQEMVITNSPQGLSRQRLEDRGYSSEEITRVMRELKIQTFRDDLLESAIIVAKALGLVRITGRSASTHPKVSVGLLPKTRGEKSMDSLYERHGFKRITKENDEEEMDPDVDWVLPLFE